MKAEGGSLKLTAHSHRPRTNRSTPTNATEAEIQPKPLRHRSDCNSGKWLLVTWEARDEGGNHDDYYHSEDDLDPCGMKPVFLVGVCHRNVLHRTVYQRSRSNEASMREGRSVSLFPYCKDKLFEKPQARPGENDAQSKNNSEHGDHSQKRPQAESRLPPSQAHADDVAVNDTKYECKAFGTEYHGFTPRLTVRPPSASVAESTA
jgi:hypothetical protein